MRMNCANRVVVPASPYNRLKSASRTALALRLLIIRREHRRRCSFPDATDG